MSRAMFGMPGSSVFGRATVRLVGTFVAVTATALSWAPPLAAPLGAPEWRGILDGHVGGGDPWSEPGVGDDAMSKLRDRLDDVAEPYPIDLCGGAVNVEQPAETADEAVFIPSGQGSSCCGDVGDGHPGRRFYITGIIGASFATL